MVCRSMSSLSRSEEQKYFSRRCRQDNAYREVAGEWRRRALVFPAPPSGQWSAGAWRSRRPSPFPHAATSRLANHERATATCRRPSVRNGAV